MHKIARFDRGWQLGILSMSILILAMSGCSKNVAAVGISPTAAIYGRSGSHTWHVEGIQENGSVCTKLIIDGAVRDHSCPPPAAIDIPVNFASEQVSPDCIVVLGVVSQAVVKLNLVSSKDRSQTGIQIEEVGNKAGRIFAFAIHPGDALDLLAEDRQGHIIFSGASKLKSIQS